MNILILAAGMGVRLGNIDQPKSLVSLKGKSLLVHLLDGLRSFFDGTIYVVGGYCIDQLALVTQKDSSIKLLSNTHYSRGSILSLLAAKEFLNDSFFLMNADHLYSPRILGKIFSLQKNPENIRILCDHDRALTQDDMKVKLNAKGNVQAISKTLSDFDLGYIGCSFIPKDRLSLYWETAMEVLKTKGDKVAVESVIQALSDRGEDVCPLDVSGSYWIEVDTPEDRAKAEQTLSMVLNDF
ncbi:MAG TPA: hypothetical protein DDW49_08165 [Deltaproteobacteria bacterium]|nr:MAG: hypothetical protein A2048_07780 [Deltaproteobacteria bacterium GWA2_45_12]HBF13338.1 hypothetical protein [Deltaproteobacteria bacterium]